MTRRITANALLAAVALIIFTIEAQIPPIVPIPGVKLGLANVITLFAMYKVGPKDTLGILLTRIILGSVFAGTILSFAFSLAGGLFCYLITLALYRFLGENRIWVVSVLGAACHNIGQILMAFLVLRSVAVAAYLPFLLLSGIITGVFTGLITQLVYQRLKKVQL